MKGYFSQLARHTGLHFTSAAQLNAPSSAAQSVPTAGAQSVPPASPLHVEEVTLVAPTTTAPASDKPNVVQHETIRSTDTTQAVATVQPDLPSTPPPSEPFSTNAQLSASPHESGRHNEPHQSTAASIETENVQRLSTELQSPVLERNVERDHISTRSSNDEVPLEHVEANFVTATSETFASLPASHQTKTESAEQAVNDPVEREILVRQYLREVRAWVAAPPIEIPDVPEHQLAQENSASAWQPENTTTFNREPLQPSAQTTQRTDLDVQETSLSIGTISVVIEDPKPAAATIAPLPTAPVAQPQTQPEPISLSRYYLQRW